MEFVTMANNSSEAKLEILHRIIPHMLGSIEALQVALHLHATWSDPQPMKIIFNDKLIVDGNSYAFINPVIEAGIIQCRTLLVFLGLSMNKVGKLDKRPPPRKDDVGVECFSNAAGPLTTISPAQALSQYNGNEVEVEAALLSVFRIANKGLAHLTSSFMPSPEESMLLDIACRHIRSLIIDFLYAPLGLSAPAPQVTSRPNE